MGTYQEHKRLAQRLIAILTEETVDGELEPHHVTALLTEARSLVAPSARNAAFAAALQAKGLTLETLTGDTAEVAARFCLAVSTVEQYRSVLRNAAGLYAPVPPTHGDLDLLLREHPDLSYSEIAHWCGGLAPSTVYRRAVKIGVASLRQRKTTGEAQ